MGRTSASLVGISADGTRVFFATYEKETADDLDANWLDIYERAANATTLISTGPAATNLPSLALFRASSLDGTRVFFQTEESLVSGDTDTVSDVYSREAPISGYPRPKGASPLRLVAGARLPGVLAAGPGSFPAADLRLVRGRQLAVFAHPVAGPDARDARPQRPSA